MNFKEFWVSLAHHSLVKSLIDVKNSPCHVTRIRMKRFLCKKEMCPNTKKVLGSVLKKALISSKKFISDIGQFFHENVRYCPIFWRKKSDIVHYFHKKCPICPIIGQPEKLWDLWKNGLLQLVIGDRPFRNSWQIIR